MSYTNDQRIADKTVAALKPVDRVITQWTLERRKAGQEISALNELATRKVIAAINAGELNEAALAQSLMEHAQVLALPSVRPIDQKLWKRGTVIYIQVAPLTELFTAPTVYGDDRRYVHACLSKGIIPMWSNLKARVTHSWEGDVMGHYWEDLLAKIRAEFYPTS